MLFYRDIQSPFVVKINFRNGEKTRSINNVTLYFKVVQKNEILCGELLLKNTTPLRGLNGIMLLLFHIAVRQMNVRRFLFSSEVHSMDPPGTTYYLFFPCKLQRRILPRQSEDLKDTVQIRKICLVTPICITQLSRWDFCFIFEHTPVRASIKVSPDNQ